MGRSKFPGKPSKSVIKDRISVLNKNDSERNQNGKKNCDEQYPCNNNSNTKNKKVIFKAANPCHRNGVQDQINLESSPSNNTLGTANDSFDNSNDKNSHIKENGLSDLLEQNQEKTKSQRNCDESLKSSTTFTVTENINNLRRKTVTFKNILETSDDTLVSRNIHNPLNKGPLISIMKKDSFKLQRYIPPKNKIVRPSRLTKILKNNANIDKTKFLSFRSVQLPIKTFESNEHTNQLEKQNGNHNLPNKIFLTGEDEKKIEVKLKDQNEDVENFEHLADENKCNNQLMQKWNIHTIGQQTYSFETKDDDSKYDVAKKSSQRKDSTAHNQIILRQPRLLFETQDDIFAKAKQITLDNGTEPDSSSSKLCNNSACGICNTPVDSTHIQQNRKYGITACEFCKTFISKITKKAVVASPISSKAFKIQCINAGGECLIPSLPKNNVKTFKQIYDERCSACWLKKCIQSFQFPFGHKLRLSSVISESQNIDIQYVNKSQKTLHFNNARDLIGEQCNTDHKSSLFSWNRTTPSKSHHGQNASLKSELFSNVSYTDGKNTRLSFLLNKKPNLIPGKCIEVPENSISSSEYPRRQKISFKGPRVKHVCRSASIALGQQIATFSNYDEEALQLSQSKSEDISEIDHENIDQETVKDVKEVTDDHNVRNITSEIKKPTISDFFIISSEKNEDNGTEGKPAFKNIKENYQNLGNKCNESSNISTSVHQGKSLASKRNLICPTSVRHSENKSKTISIDFWDTYVSAEVNQTGVGLIFTKPVSAFALCFLCGSMDLDYLLFCVSCCEPYHSYCIQEDYNTDSESVDKVEVSSEISNQLNWMCPRCTVCDTCNMSSGPKIKCQKCKKNYHNTCMGTSKGLLGADRPLLCRSCLKCHFCSTTKVSKYVGNHPTCIQCFLQRFSVSNCPLCQKSFDSVLDLIILECGVCNEFIHSKCEGLTEEQSYLLSSIGCNIKFVCNKCSLADDKSKTLSKKWREAIYKELKSRLLEVLKLLSGSRLADVLKKSTKANCQCNIDKITNDHINVLNIHKNGSAKEDSKVSNMYKLDNLVGSILQSKCLCSKSNTHQTTNHLLSLLDIKKKIVNGEYVSLFDFNADMNDVIIPLKSDDLILTYKEIISEKFSWFQNETKTCTDALEEDMFDSCNYSFPMDNITTEDQNLLTKLPLPSSEEKLFGAFMQNVDKRICIFCLKEGESDILQESRLLYYGFDCWVHANCALWSEDVYEEFDGSLQNVHSTFCKGKSIKCVVCNKSGATIKCNVETCCKYYHFQCAKKAECLFKVETLIFCPLHNTSTEKTNKAIFSNSRPLHIECNNSHKKFVEPLNARCIIGSLSVIQLGTVLSPFSDTSEAIVPINYICTRLYWSSKEPWKIVKYKVRTTIQNGSVTINNESDKNFTVDHSKNERLVEKDLSQISLWHNTLIGDDNIEGSFNNDCSYFKNFRHSTNIDYRHETLIEEGQQNNSDLLPPEIEEAIFKDLPNDILEGISMLDIFPKLMIHEDIDLGSDEKFNKLTEPTLNYASQALNDFPMFRSIKKQESKSITQKHELQRSQSEVFSRNFEGYRSQNRSSSVNWGCLIDSKRGFTKESLDEDLSETKVHSGFTKYERKGRDWKLNSKKNIFFKENKNATKLNRDKIKLLQLDGADDYIGLLNKQTVSKTHVTCDLCRCTYRTFDSFQRHFVNCEQISTSESETDTSSRSPDTSKSIIVVKEESNGNNLQLYQTQFGRNPILSSNAKSINNLSTITSESIIPQQNVNTSSFYINMDKAGCSSINSVGMNNLKIINQIERKSYEDNVDKNQNYNNCFLKVKEDTAINSNRINKTGENLQDKINYVQFLNQNLLLNDQYTPKEQQPQQQQFVIFQQSAGNNQPMLLQQVPNAIPTQNIFPVVLPNSSMQYTSVPAFGNTLVQTPIWHSDCNIMLSPGLQMMPMHSLQLASTSSQLVGSLNVPQTLQLGSNQMLIGGTSTMDLMTNGNQLVLAPQPVYYGLETIVQNTVMSSQQFVSTAIQGVLSQNASFSATTTQVFQSSKLEAVNDTPSYVVLNNVDGTTLVVPQTNMLSGFINTNNTHDFHGYNPDFGNSNASHLQTIVNQPEPPPNIFPLLPTLPEITNSTVETPIIHLQGAMSFETTSNIISSAKQHTQLAPFGKDNFHSKKENLLSQNWLQSAPLCPLKEIDGENISRIDVTETLKNNEQTTPRIIKRKTNAIPSSQTGLNIVYKNIPQKELYSNQTQDVLLVNPNDKTERFCKSLVESSWKNSPINVTSNNSKNNVAPVPLKNESISLKDISKIDNPIYSEARDSTKSLATRLKNTHSNDVTSKKLSSVSFGSSLPNVPTNIVVPIMQAKQVKTTAPRPTNRVLPMQSIHKPSMLKNSNDDRYLISLNVQNPTPFEAELFPTAKKDFEFLNPTKNMTEEKCESLLNFSEKLSALNEDLNAKKTQTKNILDGQNLLEKNESSSNIINSVESDPNDEIDKCNKDLRMNEEIKIENIALQNKDVSKMVLKTLSDQSDVHQIELESVNKISQTVNSPNTKTSKQYTDEEHANVASKKRLKVDCITRNIEPYLMYEIQSEDGFSYKSPSIADVWEKVFDAVQSSRRAHGLPCYPIGPFADICGVQILGLKTNALKYLIEQLPGVEKCQRYTPKYHKKTPSDFENVLNTIDDEDLDTSIFGAARCEPFAKRSAFDMFSWLASSHRKQPRQIFVQPSDTELIARRCTANLPMAMKYRTLKETSRLNVGVFRSLIHGRGLFCIKDIEAGEMVIEYAGELIRSTLADKRERFYDNRGIGCYMFKIDEKFVVDATMRGNAARFINHSCEPNCYSKVVDILGHKHIIIFSLRRIVQGEELTYDYKFPFEDVKIHCFCASKKCRKYLN